MNKKLLCGTLACLLSLVIGSAALADETITLAELKQQVPDNLVLDMTTHDGETIHVDMPVVLPEGDTLPVLRVKPVLFDASDMAAKYPKGKGLINEAEVSGWAYKGTHVLAVYIKPQNGKKPRSTPETSTESGRYVMTGGVPEGNGMPSTRPLEIVQENAARFSGRDDLDIRVYKQYPMSGLYHYTNIAHPDTLDLKKPRKGFEKGTWQLYPAQYIRGAEIFQGLYQPSAQYDWNAKGFWPDLACGWLFVLDEDDYGMGLCLLDETEVIIDDAPLAPFSAIQTAIEQRIQSGQLKSGYKLTLGYTICCRPGDPSGILDDSDPALARFTLIPAWRIDGYDTKDSETLGGREATQEELQRYPWQSFTLRLDARTGDPLMDYHTAL